ncbi:GNAT family N-acetyltransferase [Hydrogenophaga sp.]|uniref:GNAT family N-acetyltransferase n=1 Tax=Hydrogenophaga sp. TaxID=1904254 RepID=UPI002720F342|nr:GNAT family N-acetyltransferase [Hydrogenophaga sp.]MDO9438737.1 GNAT family N-acetyltransferase [Hydrogenophaga sp.]
MEEAPVSVTPDDANAAQSFSLYGEDSLGPRWASALAELICRYALLAGLPGGSVTVVDLSSSNSEAAFLLRRSLNGVKRLTRGSAIDLCYLPCLPTFKGRTFEGDGDASEWLQWDLANPSSAPILWPAGKPWKPRGPMVVLTGNALAHLRERPTAVHHGRVYEWNKSGAEWILQDVRAFPHEAPGSLAPYLLSMNSCQFALACGALDALRSIAERAPYGYLVVARGQGCAELADLRETSDTGDQSERPRGSGLPINFHWLAEQSKARNAVARQCRQNAREVVQLTMGGAQADEESLASVAHPLEFGAVNGANQLVRALELSCERGDARIALGLLQQSGCDASVFSRAAKGLIRAVRRGVAIDKVQWRKALGRVWDNRFAPEADSAFLRGIVPMALACEDVSLAVRAVDMLERHSRVADDLLLRAACLEKTARPMDALAICEDGLARGANPTIGVPLRASLLARLEGVDTVWKRSYGRDGCPLVLEPLAAHHAPALCHQYRDPQIAVMTGLPTMDTEDKALAWIHQKQDVETASYAVVHRDFGFVGYSDMDLSGGDGFFCFWIGTDFQGMGFARDVALMLCELSCENGVRAVWTSAFDDNARSIRALQAGGFKPLSIRAQAPHDERTFLYWSRNRLTAEQKVQGLVAFCATTNPALSFNANKPDTTSSDAATTEGDQLLGETVG